MRNIVLACCLFGLTGFQNSHAGDFGWLDSLSLSASNNQSGFQTRLAVRFNLGDRKVKAIIRDSGGNANAYMVLRLSELSGQPVPRVITLYKRNKTKGWGTLAKSLGIKPGSKAFHALKRGHDLGSEWSGKQLSGKTGAARKDRIKASKHPARKSNKRGNSGMH